MRRRLVVAIAGVAIGALALFAIPLGLVLQRSYRDEGLLRLQRDTIAATRSIDLSQGGDPVELPRSRDVLAVYDRSGARVAGRGPLRAQGPVSDALASGRAADRSEDGRLVVAVPLSAGERVAGAVRAVRSDAAVERDALAAWLVIAAIAAGVLLLATIAAVLLARRLARPLESLAADARRLGGGDFSVRTARAGVAEVDEVAAALDRSSSLLGELVARERRFSADASHQLRTPLAALRLELESLQLRDAQSEELSSSIRQVDRLEATIATLLAVARDLPRVGGDCVLAELAREAAARWHGTLAADGRPLRTRLAADDATRAAASPAVVGEILEVLLANAARHGAGAVTLTVRDAGGSLALEVGDEGPGFGAETARAFERGASSDDGHGIGLALARSLAHAEGGSLAITAAGPRPTVTLLLQRAS